MFCWAVRYSLPGGTVSLAGRYGNACRRVRYSLPSGTVMLVGGYGIVFWVPANSEINAFAGLSLAMVSKTG